MSVRFIICILLVTWPTVSWGQNSLIGLSWNMSVPTGSTTNFVGETSLRGGQFEFRDFLPAERNISLGLSIGWNGYQEDEPRQTYAIENGAVTTDLVKYTYTLPILLNVHHYFPIGENVLPYVGAGIGGMYSEHEIFFNIYNIEENEWGFAVRPEVGAIFPFGRAGLLVAADYLWATNESSTLGIDNSASLNFRLGVVLLR